MSVPAGPSEAFLILLVAGHLLGDFGLQSGRMAAGKRRGGMLVGHMFILVLAHTAALAPLVSWPIAALVLAIVLAHGAIDFIKSKWRGGRGVRRGRGGRSNGTARVGSLRIFLLDQAAHLAVLVAGWALFIRWIGVPEAHLAEPSFGIFLAIAVLAGAFAFNATGGGAVVSGVLAAHDPTLEEVGGRKEREANFEEASGEQSAEQSRNSAGERGIAGSGRLIGILERTLILILILAGQWAAIGILIAAKSIARFDELKERRFSEYYLVGTLTSLLVAVVVGLVVRVVVGG